MSPLVSETRLMWGMPITVAIVAPAPAPGPLSSADHLQRAETPTAAGMETELIARVFAYFEYVDDTFSTYRPDSEISLINQGVLSAGEASTDMRTVLALAEDLRLQTKGYFNIARDGKIDPSGLVKGWALSNAAQMLRVAGCGDFYIEAGGDFQAAGLSAAGQPWRVGIRNPFSTREIVKVLAISDRGVATSGTSIRGQHIYNPLDPNLPLTDIVSLTVIGPDVYEADCLATAAFAMGRAGIQFIANQAGFEGYLIDAEHQATFTPGFMEYVLND